MRRAIVLINRFAVAALAVLLLAPTAWGGQIYLDNNVDIYGYTPAGVPPGNTPSYFFGPDHTPPTSSLANTGGVTGMAFTSHDGAAPVLLVANLGLINGNSGGIEAYSEAGADLGAFNAASIYNPVGLAVDANGNVYTGAANGSTLEKVSPTGAGTPTVIASNLGIQALAVYGAGTVFGAGGGTATEYVGGSQTYSLDGGSNLGIAFDSAGYLFVTYQLGGFSGGGGIDEFSPTGTKIADVTTTLIPTGLAYDPESGNFYMSYVNLNGIGGGIEKYSDGAGGTLGAGSLFATVNAGQPDAIADLTPEPGSFLLSGCGLISVLLFHFRRFRRA